jgi:hypothetical protein
MPSGRLKLHRGAAGAAARGRVPAASLTLVGSTGHGSAPSDLPASSALPVPPETLHGQPCVSADCSGSVSADCSGSGTGDAPASSAPPDSPTPALLDGRCSLCGLDLSHLTAAPATLHVRECGAILRRLRPEPRSDAASSPVEAARAGSEQGQAPASPSPKRPLATLAHPRPSPNAQPAAKRMPHSDRTPLGGEGESGEGESREGERGEGEGGEGLSGESGAGRGDETEAPHHACLHLDTASTPPPGLLIDRPATPPRPPPSPPAPSQPQSRGYCGGSSGEQGSAGHGSVGSGREACACGASVCSGMGVAIEAGGATEGAPSSPHPPATNASPPPGDPLTVFFPARPPSLPPPSAPPRPTVGLWSLACALPPSPSSHMAPAFRPFLPPSRLSLPPPESAPCACCPFFIDFSAGAAADAHGRLLCFRCAAAARLYSRPNMEGLASTEGGNREGVNTEGVNRESVSTQGVNRESVNTEGSALAAAAGGGCAAGTGGGEVGSVSGAAQGDLGFSVTEVLLLGHDVRSAWAHAERVMRRGGARGRRLRECLARFTPGGASTFTPDGASSAEDPPKGIEEPVSPAGIQVSPGVVCAEAADAMARAGCAACVDEAIALWRAMGVGTSGGGEGVAPPPSLHSLDRRARVCRSVGGPAAGDVAGSSTFLLCQGRSTARQAERLPPLQVESPTPPLSSDAGRDITSLCSPGRDDAAANTPGREEASAHRAWRESGSSGHGGAALGTSVLRRLGEVWEAPIPSALVRLLSGMEQGQRSPARHDGAASSPLLRSLAEALPTGTASAGASLGRGAGGPEPSTDTAVAQMMRLKHGYLATEALTGAEAGLWMPGPFE